MTSNAQPAAPKTSTNPEQTPRSSTKRKTVFDSSGTSNQYSPSDQSDGDIHVEVPATKRLNTGPLTPENTSLAQPESNGSDTSTVPTTTSMGESGRLSQPRPHIISSTDSDTATAGEVGEQEKEEEAEEDDEQEGAPILSQASNSSGRLMRKHSNKNYNVRMYYKIKGVH